MEGRGAFIRRRRWTPFGKAVETSKNSTFANRTEDEINLEPSKLTGASAAAEDETGADQEKFWTASVDQVVTGSAPGTYFVPSPAVGPRSQQEEG